MTLDEALCNGIGNHLGEQCNRADGIIIARNRVLQIIRVSVGVEDPHHRNAKLFCFINGKVFTNRVDYPDGVRGLLQGSYSTQRFLQLGELTLLQQKFFLGETLGCVFVVNLFKLFHPAQSF